VNDEVRQPHLATSSSRNPARRKAAITSAGCFVVEPTGRCSSPKTRSSARTSRATSAAWPAAAEGRFLRDGNSDRDALANVNIAGGASVYADANGNFVIPSSGSPVTVNSPMTGLYFYVDNVAGAEETLSLSVVPPGPANFSHNAANSVEQVRAQINGYVQANVVRDFCLTYNPNYPTISTQTNFLVRVNRTDGYCPGNAWYDGSSINFCLSGSGYPNTAWSNIVHHEYGITWSPWAAGGQGAYGEGMFRLHRPADRRRPDLRLRLHGQLQYGASARLTTPINIRAAARFTTAASLISGCVWSTRNELIVTNPTTYLQILANLTVNSILLHNGDQITPQITIDFLTLDGQ